MSKEKTYTENEFIRLVGEAFKTESPETTYNESDIEAAIMELGGDPEVLKSNIPDNAPGTIFIPRVGLVQLADWKDVVIYDAGILDKSQTISFFRDLEIGGQKKSGLLTNMEIVNQLPPGCRALISDIYFKIAPSTPEDDIMSILSSGYIEFRTGEMIEFKEPLVSWENPLITDSKIAGMNNALADAGKSKTMQINVIHKKLRIPMDICYDLTFQADITFTESLTIEKPAIIWLFLKGFICKPLR